MCSPKKRYFLQSPRSIHSDIVGVLLLIILPGPLLLLLLLLLLLFLLLLLLLIVVDKGVKSGFHWLRATTSCLG